MTVLSYMELRVILLLSLSLTVTRPQRIQYLNGLFENDYCELDYGIAGRCKRISECSHEFESYRKNHTFLKVCSFSGALQNHLICCREILDDTKRIQVLYQDEIPNSTEKPVEKIDFVDFDSCRDGLSKYRTEALNTNHFGEAMMNGKLAINQENCETLGRLNKHAGKTQSNCYYCRKDYDGNYILETRVVREGSLISSIGDRPNMAAIGWTNDDGSVEYKCFGSIITDRYIVTAANCESLDGIPPDVVRVGDRYLITEKDDERAQHIKIQRFIVHPNYNSTQDYNDIALIKSAQKIIFNEFVVPSCIGDFDRKNRNISGLTVSGYGEDADEIPFNILREMEVEILPNFECDLIYGTDPRLPRGIIKSQICVRSTVIPSKYPEICFGEPGSPLQYKSLYDVPHEDFNLTFLSTNYETSTVLGIEAFGKSCSMNVPSVYTKLAFYRDWIKSVIER